MTIAWLSPVFNGEQFFDNNGVVLNGGLIYAYEAGSFSVAQTIYTDSTAGTPWTQPIVLNSSGRIDNGDIWLDSTLTYNLAVYMPDGLTILKNVDQVSGVPIPIAPSGGGGSSSSSIWVAVPTPSYVSPTSFLVVGNYTANFAVGNRVQIQNTGGSFQYGTVTAVAFSGGNTQVTIQNDSTPLSVSMTGAWYSELVVSGMTVDAGAVSYTSSLTYPAPNTVGGQIVIHQTEITNLQAAIAAVVNVWPTAGSGANTPYTVTVTPAPTSYSTFKNVVLNFTAASAGSPTLNINGLGAIPLMMYDPYGAVVPAHVTLGMCSQVAYDGTNFILLDELPPVPFSVADIPHGQATFVSNGTFTPGTGVYSVNVICVAGGGGGGGGNATGGGESGYTYFNGGIGGAGGTAFKTIAVTPGTPYTVTLGAAGGGGTYGGGTGGSGTSTVFGASLVVATGGSGGQGASTTTDGAPGAPGVDTSGAYGLYNTGFTMSGVPKGTGGAGGLGAGSGIGCPGTPGGCIVTW